MAGNSSQNHQTAGESDRPVPPSCPNDAIPQGPTANAGILRKLQRTAYRNCIPIHATFEITQRCNVRCPHCYNFDRSEPYTHAHSRNELSSSDICRIIDELAEAGCLYIGFTGGEATLHPNLLDFIRRARSRYMVVRVKTNGTLLTREKVRALAEAGAHGLDISLYGATEATFDGFTKISGSYAGAMKGLDAAHDEGLQVRLTMCLMKSNIHELSEMLQFARGRDLPFTVDPQLTSRYDGTRGSLDLRLDRSQLEWAYRGPLQGMFSAGGTFNLNLPPQCSCARSNCGISSTGEVFPCIGAPVPSGNLREKSFGEIWKKSPALNRIRALSLDDFPICKPCPHRAHCRRSSGAVYSNTSDYTGPEEWTCQEAQVLHELYDEQRAQENL